MRANKWMGRLIGCERGNAALVSAATLPLLLCSAALARDTVQLGIWTQQLQLAADAGALAGARAVEAGEPPQAAVGLALEGHRRVAMAGPPVVSLAPGAGGGRIVSVRLTSQRALPFIGALMQHPPTRTAEATAVVGSAVPPPPPARFRLPWAAASTAAWHYGDCTRSGRIAC